MKKNIFYLFCCSFLSSFLTIGIYKFYYKNETSLSYIDPLKKELSATKFISHENYVSLLGSAGLPDFVVPAENALNAVVHVKNYSTQISREQEYSFDPFDFFFGFPDLKRRQNPSLPPSRNKEKSPIPKGYGSGVIVSDDGFIITNNHVIDGADKIMITLNDQTAYQAKVIGADAASDVALLKINIKNKKLEYLKLADSDEVKVGEWVLAIGNPMSLNSTVTAGIISAKNRNLGILSATSKGVPPIESFIQTDAAINPGNSGGALVNTKGELIGINTAISSKSGRNEGYGFAIPSNIVKKVVEDLKKYGFVQRAYLGIQVIDLSSEELVEVYNHKNKNKTKINPQQGILIDEFTENSAAKQSGLKKGDIIKKIDGKDIKNYANLSSVVANKRPGDSIWVEVLRESKYLSKKITLKSIEGKSKIKTRDQMSALELLGAEFEVVKKSEKENQLSIGLRVSKINKGGILDKLSSSYSLEEGDVITLINRIKLNKLTDLETALTKSSRKLKSIEFVKEESGEVIFLSFGLKGLE